MKDQLGLWNVIRELARTPRIPVERIVRDEYFKAFCKVDGAAFVKKEVSTPVGRIDLITKDFVFEFKRIKQWKAAIGQILVYSFYYSEKTKALLLIGSASEGYKHLIKKHAATHGVVVFFSDLDSQIIEAEERANEATSKQIEINFGGSESE